MMHTLFFPAAFHDMFGFWELAAYGGAFGIVLAKLEEEKDIEKRGCSLNGPPRCFTLS